MQKYAYDFGFGEPYFARQALSNYYTSYSVDTLKNHYPDLDGDILLKAKIKEVIYSQTGWMPNHIVITGGATNALYLILKFLNDGRKESLNVSVNPYHFMFYTKIAYEANVNLWGNLPSVMLNLNYSNNNAMLVDSPSNPTGNIFTGFKDTISIWDAVYHNYIYTDDLTLYPKCPIVVGSFSKLFGLAGSRLGWIATDDAYYYLSLSNMSNSINCGINLQSQQMMVDIFDKVDLDKFYKTARLYLDDNRTEFAKLEYIFGAKIRRNGMFYVFPYDNSLYKKMQDIGVNAIRMTPTWAGEGFPVTNESMIRMSLGNDRTITKNAVKEMLLKL